MGLLDRLFGGRPKFGSVYCGHGVKPAHAQAAEEAIASNQYVVHTSTKDQSSAVLILKTEPPLIALISREPSFINAVPDIIIRAVYDVRGDPVAQAQDLWEML
jgi:hypothetical protein